MVTRFSYRSLQASITLNAEYLCLLLYHDVPDSRLQMTTAREYLLTPSIATCINIAMRIVNGRPDTSVEALCLQYVTCT